MTIIAIADAECKRGTMGKLWLQITVPIYPAAGVSQSELRLCPAAGVRKSGLFLHEVDDNILYTSCLKI